MTCRLRSDPRGHFLPTIVLHSVKPARCTSKKRTLLYSLNAHGFDSTHPVSSCRGLRHEADAGQPHQQQFDLGEQLRQDADCQPVTASPGAVIRPPASRNENAPRATPALANLVSGKVDSAVSRGQGFDAPRGAPMPNSSGALQMYSRAADRVEVATNATLGRLLDTRA